MRKYLQYALLLSVMFLSGCVETIVMDPHEKDLPVVIHCVLSNPTDKVYFVVDSASLADSRQKQSMTIKYAKGKSADEYIPVEDAVVLIHASDSLAGTEGTMRFVHIGNGTWESENAVRILEDTKYSLSVSIPGRETIWAETVSQSMTKPGLYLPDDIMFGDHKEAMEFVMKHPFAFGSNGDSPAWVFAQGYTPEGWKELKYLVTDHPYADDFNVTGQHFSDMTLLGSRDADDETDAYLQQIFEKSMGYFPDLPLHEGYLRISKIEEQVPFFLFAGPVWFQNLEANDYYGMYDEWPEGYTVDPETLERTPVYKKEGWTWNKYFRFCFHLVNSDLDEYLRSIYIQELESRNYLTALYSTANTYTNIHGGLGIFGCDFWANVDFRAPLDFMLAN